MPEELKPLPCPACGNPDAVVSVTTRAAVYCPMCGMCGPWLPKGRYGICCQTMEHSSPRHDVDERSAETRWLVFHASTTSRKTSTCGACSSSTNDA